MEAQRTIIRSFLAHVDISNDIASCLDERAVFVDVGGGVGGQCLALLDRYPEIRGRIILQDQPHVVEDVQLPERIEKMAYNFFTPQPIANAKVYYLRAVLHDHCDQDASGILQHLADVTAPDSLLLLNELVVPTTGAGTIIMQSDISMTMYYAAAERTAEQWTALLKYAGLTLLSVETDPEGFGSGIIRAVK